MTQRRHCARRFTCAFGLLLSTVFLSTVFATPTRASTIYEFREAGTSAVIGVLEIASPPASATTGWSTVDPSDFIALYLNDSVFDLGTGNLLPNAATVSGAVLSLDGSNLDIGIMDISFPTIPSDPLIDQFLSFLFGVPGGSDFIGLATIKTFSSGVVTEDLFFFGDWQEASSVPEPGTAVLVVSGLAAAGRIARRKRR